MIKTESGEVVKISEALAAAEPEPKERTTVIEEGSDKFHQKKIQALRDQLELSMGPRQHNQAEGISYLSSPNFGNYDFDPDKLITSGSAVPATFGEREDGLMHTEDLDEMIFDAGEYKEHVFLHRQSR